MVVIASLISDVPDAPIKDLICDVVSLAINSNSGRVGPPSLMKQFVHLTFLFNFNLISFSNSALLESNVTT